MSLDPSKQSFVFYVRVRQRKRAHALLFSDAPVSSRDEKQGITLLLLEQLRAGFYRRVNRGIQGHAAFRRESTRQI